MTISGLGRFLHFRHLASLALNVRSLNHPIIIKSKQPQNRRRDLFPIMFQIRSLRRPIRMLQIIDPATIHPHLNLPLHHVLIKRQMRLRREQSVRDIQPLNGCVLAVAPDVNLRALFEETVGGLDRGGFEDLVLVHLVEVDLVFVLAEEALADGC